jgi:hypothetical protein
MKKKILSYSTLFFFVLAGLIFAYYLLWKSAIKGEIANEAAAYSIDNEKCNYDIVQQGYVEFDPSLYVAIIKSLDRPFFLNIKIVDLEKWNYSPVDIQPKSKEIDFESLLSSEPATSSFTSELFCRNIKQGNESTLKDLHDSAIENDFITIKQLHRSTYTEFFTFRGYSILPDIGISIDELRRDSVNLVNSCESLSKGEDGKAFKALLIHDLVNCNLSSAIKRLSDKGPLTHNEMLILGDLYLQNTSISSKDTATANKLFIEASSSEIPSIQYKAALRLQNSLPSIAARIFIVSAENGYFPASAQLTSIKRSGPEAYFWSLNSIHLCKKEKLDCSEIEDMSNSIGKNIDNITKMRIERQAIEWQKKLNKESKRPSDISPKTNSSTQLRA